MRTVAQASALVSILIILTSVIAQSVNTTTNETNTTVSKPSITIFYPNVGTANTTYPVVVARLGIPFNLFAKQEAVISEYGDMRIQLKSIETFRCFTAPCPPDVAKLIIFAPTSFYKSIDYGTELRLIQGSSAELYGTNITLVKLADDSATFIVTKAKQEPIYTKLNQDFTLDLGQEAHIVDYKNMKVKFVRTVCIKAITPCPPDYVQLEVSAEEINNDKRQSVVSLINLKEGGSVEVFDTELTLKSLSRDWKSVTIRVEKNDVVYCEDNPTDANCVCRSGTKSIIELLSYPSQIRYVCIEGVTYVPLNEKFLLKENQIAVLTEFKTIQMKLNHIVETSVITETAASIPLQQGERVPGTHYVNVDITYRVSPSGWEQTQNLNIAIGESREIFGVRLSLIDIIDVDDNTAPTGKAKAGLFAFERVETISDTVDIGIEPREQKVVQGDKVEYELTIVDKHPKIAVICEIGQECPQPTQPKYTYRLQVIGLPFGKDVPSEVVLESGERKKVILTVNTAVSEEPAEETIPVTDVGQTTSQRVSVPIRGKAVANIQKKCLATNVNYEECLISKQISKQETVESTGETDVVEEVGTVDVGKLPDPSQRVRPYKFAVRVVGESNEIDVAYAALLVAPEDTPPTPSDTIEISLKKGWNLVTFPGKPRDVRLGGCDKLVGYVYIAEEKRFVSLQEAQRILGDKVFDYLSKHAFWVYSKSDCSIVAKVDSQVSYDSMNIVEGWNLVPITVELVGKSFKDVSENCDIAKIYFWNADTQKWESVTPEQTFSEKQIYKGLAVKSNNYCELGNTVVSPPPFPE